MFEFITCVKKEVSYINMPAFYHLFFMHQKVNCMNQLQQAWFIHLQYFRVAAIHFLKSSYNGTVNNKSKINK